MKKRILALVLSVSMVLASVSIPAYAADKTVTITNDDKTTESYTYDDSLYEIDTDHNGATVLKRILDGYVFYPNTEANNGLSEAYKSDDVSADGNGLEVHKSVTQYPINEEGEYTITLEAYTTGEVTGESITVPTDIVLVIDQSDSMFLNLDTDTRQKAMKDAVDAFVDSVYTSATTDSEGNALDPADYVDHRIAMVVYGTDQVGEESTENFDRTKILSDFVVVTATDAYDDVVHTNMIGTQIGETKSYTNAKDYLKGLIDNLPTDDANGNPTQNDDSRTPIHSGMKLANRILSDAQSDSKRIYDQRNHVVILLTDGVPAYGLIDGGTHGSTEWWNFDEDCANASIEEAYKTKHTYDASVFTIGFTSTSNANIITGATGTDSTAVGATWNASGNAQSAIANRFLNFVSSNCMTAEDLGADSIREGGSATGKITGWTITDEYEWTNNKFYSTASTAGGLKSVFESLASNVSAATINLPKETQVHDYLSNYFEMPAGFSASDVTVYKVASKGGIETKDSDDKVTSTKYTWEESATDITTEVHIKYVETPTGVNEGIVVDGFDFNANFVSVDDKSDDESGDYGSKLVIQFNIVPIDGFIGGNDVITNTAASGVYAPEIDETTGEVKPDGEYSSVQTYPVPNTNVVVEYDISTADQTVYLGNSIMLYKILELDGHTVEGILNEFVNIQFSIYDDGILDEHSNYVHKLNVDGTDKTVYKDADRYYYYNSANEKEYTDTGGNYVIQGDKLYYEVKTYDEHGNETVDDYEIFLEAGGYYYETTEDNHVELTEDQAQYYKDLALATFFIPAGMSAEDASKLKINADQNILPAECTHYDLECFAVPNVEYDPTQGYLAEQLNQESRDIVVHVLQPQVEAGDIWVDYGAQVNVRLDGVSPISWSGITHEAGGVADDLYNANADYPPTVYYIYHNKVTNEYIKQQYQVDWNNDGNYDEPGESNNEEVGKTYTQTTWDDIDITYKVVEDLDINVESEKQYEIIAIQTLSSDGFKEIEYWSRDSKVYTSMGDSNITTDNQINVYINKYDVDITKTVTTTELEWATYPQSFIFEVSQTAFDYTEDLGEGAISNGTTVDNDGTTHEITYRKPDITEVVMEPSEFNEVSRNEDGTVNYTCTKTVKDLRAGLEAVITEDESWSWRYDLTETSVDTIIAGDVDVTTYGTIEYNISTDQVITVNYSHELWETGYETVEEVDTNLNGFNDTIVDITGDGIPDEHAFVYRDRNDDGYTDIDVLEPLATVDEVKAGDYTKFDIPFDMDQDGFIDMLVSAEAPEADGRRKITSSKTSITLDYFNGFYINKDGNIETPAGNMIFNRANGYFNGYYVFNTTDTTSGDYGKIVGGNGGIYKHEDTERFDDLNAKKDFYIINADGIGTDGDGSIYDGVTGVANILISTGNGIADEDAECYGTGRIIISEPENLAIFNRDGIAGNDFEILPLSVRDTYRYINSNEYLVFTDEYRGVGKGGAPEKGQIDTYFTNMLENDKWLSHDDVIANKFSELTVLGGAN